MQVRAYTLELLMLSSLSFLMLPRPSHSTLFPYTTLFRSEPPRDSAGAHRADRQGAGDTPRVPVRGRQAVRDEDAATGEPAAARSEEHTSELQSHSDLVCRLLLEKKNID